ncbi:hypothetical protein DdX_11985 [Ditylenchus destructor]|uniref:Uncharacterized protein n=1 Tax=Ditylenchus destructor TaxID=166010 RepID=A0AAD4QXT0_9BILA|nr:hypothetical protein DdX_11985 [Ditylenchus destructor]
MFHDSCARARPFISNKNHEAFGIDAHDIKNELEWNTTATARSPDYAKAICQDYTQAFQLEIHNSCARTRPFEPTRIDKTDKTGANEHYNSILPAQMPTHFSEMEACQRQIKPASSAQMPRIEDDAVMEEFGIVVAPDFVNRLVFPIREQQIRSVKFKKNVKRLRFEIGQKLKNYDGNVQDSDDEIIT